MMDKESITRYWLGSHVIAFCDHANMLVLSKESELALLLSGPFKTAQLSVSSKSRIMVKICSP